MVLAYEYRDIDINVMTSLIEALTMLGEPDHIETLIRCFAALTRVKKLKDEKANGGENEITDLFLATVSCKAVKNIDNGLRKRSRINVWEIV